MTSDVPMELKRGVPFSRSERLLLIVVLFLLILAPLIVARPAVAQGVGPFERILLPITVNGEQPGAYGSVWIAEVNARAIGTSARFRQFIFCEACLPTYELPADVTVELPVARLKGPTDPAGTLIYLQRDPPADVQLHVRVADISRSQSSCGTEIPVVRESSFLTQPLTLIAIPVNSQSRDALRIYDVDSTTTAHFRLQIFDENTGQLLVDDIRAVQPSPDPGPASMTPSVVEVGSLTNAYPFLVAAKSIAITITPVATGTRYWAFVSITNNETQNITTITPQTCCS